MVVLFLALSMLAAPAAAEPATLSSEAMTSSSEATITYTLQNTGKSSSGYVIDILEIPSGYRFVEQSSERGVWKNSTKVWFFQSVDSGEAVSASITIKEAKSTNETPTIVANVVDNEGKQDTSQVTIETTETGSEEGTVADLPVNIILVALLSAVVILLVAILIQLRNS